MSKGIDYDSLSKEDLIKLLLKSDEENKKLSKEINKKNKAISYRDSKIEKLEVENRNLNIQIEQLIAKYEDKLMASKKFQIEKFIPSSEKLKDEDLIINEIEAVKEKKSRKSPTESFIKDLRDIKRAEDVVIDYDFNGIDTSKIRGNIGKDSFKTISENYNRQQRLIVQQQIANAKDANAQKKIILDAVHRNIYSPEEGTAQLKLLGVDANLQQSNQTKLTQARVNNYNNPKPRVSINIKQGGTKSIVEHRTTGSGTGSNSAPKTAQQYINQHKNKGTQTKTTKSGIKYKVR